MKRSKKFLAEEVARLMNENAELKAKSSPYQPIQEVPIYPKIAEIEALLKNEEDVPFHILPNGEIRAYTPSEKLNKELGARKPITMKEDLGGEYAQAA